MDVGINLHDLRGSGRLSAFARFLGVGEHEAIGVLADAWAETQDRELCLVTQEQFVSAVGLRFDDPVKVFAAMKRALLVVPVETPEAGLGPTEHWLIRGNEKHVAKLRAYRASAVAGGKASAAKRHPNGAPKPKRSGAERLTVRSSDGVPNGAPLGTRPVNQRAPEPEPWLLVTGIDTEEDLRAPAPEFSPATPPALDPRSSVSSDAKNSVGLSAQPSAAADALSVLDLPKPKRKERSPEQKKRSVGNARLYCELYEQAEGHPPTGLDQGFYGAMAKFSDKHAEGAEHILRWVFQHCPDKGFRAKGWPLPLIIEQAPRLWRELNNPRAAVENIAAPRQQQQMALAASNDLAFEEYHRRKAERLANANQV